jgi:hypothetical protein
MGERGPDKNTIVWILVLIVIGLFAVSFINPWFYFDDIIYYAFIAIIIIAIISCVNNGKEVNVNIGRSRPVSIRWGNRCGACGKELPSAFRPGQYCPYCDTYIGIKRGIRRSFDINFGLKPPRPSVADEDDDAIGKVQYPKYRQAGGRGSRYDALREQARSRQAANQEGKDPRPSSQPSPAGACPFQPPFDDLFKNQDLAPVKLAGRIDWRAVHVALKAWATGVLTRTDARDEDARKDAFAKWEAWMAFDRAGLEDATLLPIFYQREFDAVTNTVTEQTPAEKKPICPGCGASGDDVVPLSIPTRKDARQEFTCKTCGQVFY